MRPLNRRNDPVSALLDDAASYDAVVASGGDGTVATVNYLLANTGVPVLPFPAGNREPACAEPLLAS
mgnify:CR=1 FL=1